MLNNQNERLASPLVPLTGLLCLPSLVLPVLQVPQTPKQLLSGNFSFYCWEWNTEKIIQYFYAVATSKKYYF